MAEATVCPRCNRVFNGPGDTCPYCGSHADQPLFMPDSREADPSLRDPGSPPGEPEMPDNQPVLSAEPEAMSFIYKYLMAFIPVLLVIASIFIRAILEDMSRMASSAVTSVMPSAIPVNLNHYAGTMGQYLGSPGQYLSGFSDVTAFTILLIAPVGIFIIVTAIGWTMRLTGLWSGTALTLGMSAIVGVILSGGSGGTIVSQRYVLLLLEWIAFLVQPFSILAAVLVLAGTEKFRRSIRYTITRNGIVIRGGIWRKQEHMIPHLQIGRVVMEQDPLGSLFNYGTVIPQSSTRWGSETSFRGVGATGQKDSLLAGIGFARSREEASRYPLDCLFGISNPGRAQKILERFMCSQAVREEEQVRFLKEIAGKDAGGNRDNPIPGTPGATPDTPVNHECETCGGLPAPREPAADPPVRENPDRHPDTIVRLPEDDFSGTFSCSVCGKREISPYIGYDGNCYCRDHLSHEGKETPE